MNRSLWIDSCRFLAIFVIMCTHFLAEFSPSTLQFWEIGPLSWLLHGLTGKFSVSFFFVMLGYFASKPASFKCKKLVNYALQRYARALKQRNEVLKAALSAPSLMATIDSWDEQLAIAGAELMRHRRAYIEQLSAVAAETHLHIADGKEKLEIRYLPSITRGDGVEDAMEALFAARENDARRLTTSVGAHRDEVQILVEGRDVRAYGSQGQQRTAALSMRLSELTVMHDELGEWPMLMLDDVMSELDPGRRRQLVSRLEGIQTFITCTDEDDLAGASIGRAWRVESGAIARI